MKEIFKNKSIENIKVAELAFEVNCYNASANRAYYAVFHAAIAAIYSIGIKPRIDHRSIHTIFTDNYFNRKKLISSSYKSYFSDLQDKRNSADYRIGVSKKVAKQQLDKAKELVEIILKVIE